MSNIEKILERFASSKKAGAYVLRGSWGVGKSYLWSRVILPKVMIKPWVTKYSYVSLFGISSLAELKVALAVATEESDQLAKRQARWWVRLRARLNRMQSGAVAATALIPAYGAQLSIAATTIGFYLIRSRIICFDDIERKGASLSMRDFLGMVSYLSEQRNCRVVVIMNSNALSSTDVKDWDENKEKVFSGEVEFQPSSVKATELALDQHKDEPWHFALQSAFVSLDVKNVRLIQRGADFMSFVKEAKPAACGQDTWLRIAKVVALLTFSVLGRGDGGPPLEMIFSRRVSFASRSEQAQEKQSPQEKEWQELLGRQQIYLRSVLDQALVDMVRTGVADNDRLSRGIAEYEADVGNRACAAKFTEAWAEFHGTLGENGDDIARKLIETWPLVSERENANNLMSVVELLRLVGRADQATAFIESWVRDRSGARIEELSSKVLHRFDPVTDKELLEAVALATQSSNVEMPIQAALLCFASGQDEESAFIAVSRLDPSQLLEELAVIRNDNVSEILKALLAYSGFDENSPRGRAARVCEDMCSIYASSSSLGAHRLKIWLGYELAEASS